MQLSNSRPGENFAMDEICVRDVVECKVNAEREHDYFASKPNYTARDVAINHQGIDHMNAAKMCHRHP
jgi:hypothetical protein